eukprot:171581-Hanusia_phi.AAC.1
MSLTSLKTCCRRLGLSRWPTANQQAIMSETVTIEASRGPSASQPQPHWERCIAVEGGSETSTVSGESENQTRTSLSSEEGIESGELKDDQEEGVEVWHSVVEQETGQGYQGWVPLERRWIAWYMSRDDENLSDLEGV